MKGLRYIGDTFILSKFLGLFLNKVCITIPGSYLVYFVRLQSRFKNFFKGDPFNEGTP